MRSQGHEDVIITGCTSTCRSCGHVWDTNDINPPPCKIESLLPNTGLKMPAPEFDGHLLPDYSDGIERNTAPEILLKAKQHLEDRAAQRDKPEGERSMAGTIAAFNAITGHNLSERDGWIFMVCLKAKRACTTATGIGDDYEDGAAYFALAGESANA